MRISVICPSIGRSTLRPLRDQLLRQMGAWDQFIVVGDGPQPAARAIMEEVGDIRLGYLETEPTGHWGAEQMDLGIAAATGDYLMMIGDDDEMFMDALRTVRSVVSTEDPHPYLFAMMYEGRRMEGIFGICQCSGQQFVWPNDPARTARFADDSGEANDWSFMWSTVALWGGRVEFRDELIATLHRRNKGRVW